MQAFRLKEAVPVEGRHAVNIKWRNGALQCVDLLEYIKETPGLHRALDLSFFAKVHVGEWGFGIYWPGGIEITAVTLHLLARSQKRGRLRSPGP